MRAFYHITVCGLVAIFVVSCANKSLINASIHSDGSEVMPQVLQGGGLPLYYTRFSPNTYTSEYGGITIGPDKNVWFTDPAGAGIVRMSMGGSSTEFPLPLKSFSAYPVNVSASKSVLYVLDCDGGVDVVSPDGSAKAYALPPNELDCTDYSDGVSGLTVDSSGVAWITGRGQLIRVTSSGSMTEYNYPDGKDDNYNQNGITPGPDGRIWFIEPSPHTIDAIDPSTGVISQYAVASTCAPSGAIVSPKDRNLWFGCGEKIGKITPGGVSTFYPGVFGGGTLSATVGPDGNPWFTGGGGGIYRLNTANGTVSYSPSRYNDNEIGIASAPDGNLWMSTLNGHIDVYIRKILRVSPTNLNFASPQLQAGITVSENGKPKLSSVSSNVGIATVTGPVSGTFTVQSQSVGYCTITIKDAIGNSYDVNVTVQ